MSNDRSDSTGVVATTAQTIARGTRVAVMGLTLNAGANAATAQLRTGGSGGTILVGLQCSVANDSRHARLPGVEFSDGVHVTVSGTGVGAIVYYFPL